jgi:hypothetical protein
MSEPQAELTPREKILAWMAAHGVTVESTFVPYSQSRHAKAGGIGGEGKPWPSLNWSVRIMAPGPADRFGARAPREVVATDYSAGSDHAPASKADKAKIARAASFYGRSDSVTRADMIAWELENGRAVASAFGGGFSGRDAIKPDPCDVLHSLARDSDVIDAGGFEEWARDLGYDTDSRKAESIYRACLEIALKLRAGLGEQALADLREACVDY